MSGYVALIQLQGKLIRDRFTYVGKGGGGDEEESFLSRLEDLPNGHVCKRRVMNFPRISDHRKIKERNSTNFLYPY